VSGESAYDITQADLNGMNLPENGHFTATSGNVTEDNITIHLRKLGCKEEMLAKEVEDSVQRRVLVLVLLNYRILPRKL
jgi:hypothetical protein